MREWGKRGWGNSHDSRESEEERQTSEPSLGWGRRLKGGITRAKGERKEPGSDRRRTSPSASVSTLDQPDSSGAKTETGYAMPIPIHDPSPGADDGLKHFVMRLQMRLSPPPKI
jgi:hypothetical protein